MPRKYTPTHIYQFKITLLGTSPLIWRRILMPADLTLSDLHHVLQVVMGWKDCHLHEFRIGRRRFGMPDLEDVSAPINEREVHLSDVLNQAGAQAKYTYDFGDNWQHSIILDKVLPAEPGALYPACIDGERNSPPEDCGGVEGYSDLLTALRDPDHEEHQESMEWIGGTFDPEIFAVHQINQRLAIPFQDR